MVFARPPISIPSSLFTKPLGIVPSAPPIPWFPTSPVSLPNLWVSFRALHLSSSFQLLQPLYQAFGYCSERTACPLVSNFSSLFTKPLVIVPSAPLVLQFPTSPASLPSLWVLFWAHRLSSGFQLLQSLYQTFGYRFVRSTCPPVSNFSSLFTKPLGIVPSAPPVLLFPTSPVSLPNLWLSFRALRLSSYFQLLS